MTYTIKLPQFEGPFDLLLFFIERDELDIYNIPIAKITDDFLAYIHEMESLNIDLASEFILVAASLMRVKARMLIPRKELDETGNEIDPREELVARLLEYKRYKSVIAEMRDLEATRGQQSVRGNISTELERIANTALADAELESLTLFKLLRTFERVMERHEYESKIVHHKVVKFDYTVAGQKDFLLSICSKESKADFKSIFKKCDNRIHAIFTFLAMLELIQLRKLNIVIGEGANNFWITPNIADEP